MVEIFCVLTRLLDANDPEIQMKVLDCLLMWRDKDKGEENLLVAYDQHLKNLISFSTFREELTTWSLYRESKLINENHRDNLVPIVIRLLMPKVRKLKKHASRKVLFLLNLCLADCLYFSCFTLCVNSFCFLFFLGDCLSSSFCTLFHMFIE